ncbi:MAG: DUF5606 domain-containing protein [Bacteroidales bacterium]|nr:DUF5606 domain-containing protein [Bacteroidales bacterium]
MLKKIVSISTRPGLFKLVSNGNRMLIVESLLTGKRSPAYAHDKVVSLGDISIYTNEGDVPLADVLTSLHTLQEGKPVDLKALNDESALRSLFAKVVPDYDVDRVYPGDMRKLFSWYNLLLEAGIKEYKEPEEGQTSADDK